MLINITNCLVRFCFAKIHKSSVGLQNCRTVVIARPFQACIQLALQNLSVVKTGGYEAPRRCYMVWILQRLFRWVALKTRALEKRPLGETTAFGSVPLHHQRIPSFWQHGCMLKTAGRGRTFISDNQLHFEVPRTSHTTHHPSLNYIMLPRKASITETHFVVQRERERAFLRTPTPAQIGSFGGTSWQGMWGYMDPDSLL